MSTSPTTEAARALAAARRIVQAQCEVCGKPIEGITRRRTCSAACRTRAYYRRQHGLPIADADQPRASTREGADVPPRAQ